MDIDALVEKLTASSRTKITDQEKAVQTLLWKQEAYRSVSKSLIEFRAKYLDILNPSSNLKSTSIYNTIKATLPDSVKAFTATAVTGAAAGKMTVNSIQQLATATQVTNVLPLSKPVAGAVDESRLVSALDDIRTAATDTSGATRAVILTLDGSQRVVVINKAFVDKVDLIADPSASPSDAEVSEAFTKVFQDELNLMFNGKYASNFDFGETSKVTVSLDSSGLLSFGAANSSSKLSVASWDNKNDTPDSTLGILGLTENQTNRLDPTKSLDSLAGSLNGFTVLTPGADGNFKFNINGVYFDINKGQSLNDLISAVNNSTAGVTMAYSELTDKITLTAKTTGPNAGMMGSSTSGGGNLLEALSLQGPTATLTLGKNAILYVNGTRIERASNDFTIDGVQLSLKDTFNNMTLSGQMQHDEALAALADVAGGGAARSFIMELNGQSKTIVFDKAFADDVIDLANSGTTPTGKDPVMYAFTSLLQDKVNTAFGTSGGSPKISVSLTDEGVLSFSPQDTGAQLTIRQSTTDANGADTLEILGFGGGRTTALDPSDPAYATRNGAVIDLSPNSDKLLETIKSFVEDYNTMITYMKGLLKEATESGYAPLTDAEKAEMTEAQINSWESKAKAGILRNDSLLNTIVANLQNSILNVNTGGFGMYSIGIQSGGWQDDGKLTIDEEKLKAALDTNPDQVMKLFTEQTKTVTKELRAGEWVDVTTYSPKGVAYMLDKAIDDAVRTNGVRGARGTLIEMAGYAATRSDIDSSIYDKIATYNKRISLFKSQLEAEESRLWAKFSAMESALQNLNNQSSILTQYFSQSTGS
jgi:flagellar hook-associated protein 2